MKVYYVRQKMIGDPCSLNRGVFSSREKAEKCIEVINAKEDETGTRHWWKYVITEYELDEVVER